jgi:hypothetical protein
MIDNATQARELSNKSTDPKLQQTLRDIEDAAGKGKYSLKYNSEMSETLINNLKARGFVVYNEMTISW